MNIQTKIKLRIGKIKYLNCLPFYFGLSEALKEKGFDPEAVFFKSYPAQVNEAMQKGEIDFAPLSSLEYFQHQDDYLLMGLGIGARLFSRSVLLLSKKKIEELDHAAIALSKESLSAAGLVRILLKEKYGFRNSFQLTEQDPEAMLQQYPAALVIGDQALFCQPRDMIYKYDLGELWRSWTGKPFVFALWAVRKEFAEVYPEQTAVFCNILKENLLKNLSDPQAFLKQALEMGPEDKKYCQVLGYLTNLQYELTEDMKEGALRFFELAHEHGLALAPKPLIFLK